MIRQQTETFWGTALNDQSYQGYIVTTVDPTGTAPSFGITAQTDIDGPTTWVVGSWSGTWDSVTHKTLAVTPTMGLATAGPSLTITGTGAWRIWAKVVVGVETWTEPIFDLRVPS